VRKTRTTAIISHPSNVPNVKGTLASKLGQIPELSSNIKIPDTIVRNVTITINLLGGVHPPIFFTNELFIFV